MKNKIMFYLKIILLTWPPILGYFFLYASTWIKLDLPVVWWSVWLWAASACLSEWLFLKWVGRWEDDE